MVIFLRSKLKGSQIKNPLLILNQRRGFYLKKKNYKGFLVGALPGPGGLI
jgi:hypothetical protein